MNWSVKIAAPARSELNRLYSNPDLRPVWKAAMDAVTEFTEDPFPPGHLELDGYPGYFRIRIYGGAYRIIYHVSERLGRVRVLYVRKRDRHTYEAFN